MAKESNVTWEELHISVCILAYNKGLYILVGILAYNKGLDILVGILVGI